MSQYIIYGTDTGTYLGVDEATILIVPDDMHDFEEYISEHHYDDIPQKQVAPLEDVYDSFTLALSAEGVSAEVIASAIATVNDALVNNLH